VLALNNLALENNKLEIHNFVFETCSFSFVVSLQKVLAEKGEIIRTKHFSGQKTTL